MKKIIVIIILLGGTLISNASTPINKHDGNETQLVKKLVSKINLTENLKKKSNTGIVTIEFKISETNTLEIKNISGKNKEFQNHIKSQLENQKIEVGSLEKNVSYFFDINFKII